MRKSFSCVLSLMVLLSAVIGLRAQTGSSPNLLYVDFEDGKIPQEWEIVHQRGDCDWVVVSDGVSAGNHFITLKNGTTVQQNYRTLLVSPQMDIISIASPVVIFAHRQRQRTGDVDPMRLLYRTGNGKEWSQLAVFDSTIDDWRFDTVYLNNPTVTYQIAFEGTDNMGGGIDIDNIIVRPSPRCEQPSNISISSPTDVSCVLNWYAGFEAIDINVKVSTRKLAVEQLNASEKPDGLVFEKTVPGTDIELEVTGLVPDTEYYAYIQSVCTNDKSEWSEGFHFRTTYRVNIPYYESFNMPYQAMKNSDPEHWICRTSTGKQSPFVNTATRPADLHLYSRDSSTALCFSANSETSAIPAGQWSYAASPMIDVEKIQDVHVSFEARVSNAGSVARSIILGVMTEPELISSFTPVDTFVCANLYEYYTFSASLDKYSGDGKYIAILSDFDKNNMVYVDNFRVEYEMDVKKPSDVIVKVPSATELEISWDANGAPTADIVLAKKYCYLSAEPIEAADTVKVITGITAGQPYMVSDLAPWNEYYVYVRNVNGDKKSPWSTGIYRRMPEQLAGESIYFDFNIDKNDPSTFYSNRPYQDVSKNEMCNGVLTLYNVASNSVIPRAINTYWPNDPNKARSPWRLDMTLNQNDEYEVAIFPEMEDIRTYRAKFWYSSDASNNSNNSIVVGIMSDASDVSTFYPLDTIFSEGRYVMYTVEFDKYPKSLDGRFFAIMADIKVNPHIMRLAESTGKVYSYFRIDDLTLEKIPGCREPYEVDVQTTTATAELNWVKQADAYNIRLYTDTLPVASLDDQNFQFVYSADNVTILPLKIENLAPQQRKYYYYIQPVCGGTKGNWSTGAWFKTQCADKYPLPYHMDFDGYEHKGKMNTEFAIPCLYTCMMQINQFYYPYVTDRQDFYNGRSSLHLEATGKVKNANAPAETYLAFPEMDIDNVNELQITFAIRSAVDQLEPVEVGVMTDPYDLSTFEKYTTVKVKSPREFYEIVVPFDGYQGNGKYIAFHIKPDSSAVAVDIDSVVIERIRCVKADSLTVLNMNTNSAKLAWKDTVSTTWDLVVSSRDLSFQQLDNAVVGTDGVVFSQRVDNNPYILSDVLEPNTVYYFYVRGVCSETDKASWSFKACKFRTPCTPLRLGDFGVQGFELDEDYFNCWILGSSLRTENMMIPNRSELYRHTGKHSLQLYSTKQYNGAYAISPMLDVDDVRKVDVSFYGSATDKYSDPSGYGRTLVVGAVSSPYNLASFVPLDTVYGYGDEQFYRVRLDRYKTDDQEDGKYVMFLSEYDGNNYFFIDDVRFDTIAECAVPVDLTISEVSSNSAKITWRGGDAPYTVVYSDKQLSVEDLDGGTGTVVDNINITETEIAGLNHQSTYFVYVRSGCIGGTWSAPVRFDTECLDKYPLPYYDNFDRNLYRGRRPSCWNAFYTGGSAAYPCLDNTAYKGKSVMVYSSKTGPKLSYLITPELVVDDITECYASFYLAGNSKDQRNLVVGIVDDITDETAMVASFVPVDTILVKSTEFEKYIVPLRKDGYSANGKYVAFMSLPGLNLNSAGNEAFDGGVYIDEVEIGLYEPCPMPDFVSFDKLTDTEVEGAFRELGDATAWQAVCVVSGADAATGSPIDVTDCKFAFSGLTPRTGYDIYLRSACAEAQCGYTPWSRAYTVRTANVPLKDFPFFTGFESEDVANAEWEYANDKANYWHIGSAEHKDGNGGLYVTDDGGETSHYTITEESTSFIYRTVEFEPGAYTVEYDWLCFGEGTVDILKIGLFPTTIRLEAGNLNIASYGDGSPFTVSGLPAGAHPQYIPLEGIEAMNHTQQYRLCLNEIWKHNKVDIIVKEKGIYNLVITWMNNDMTGTKPSPAAILDNISIRQSECVQPVNIRFDDSDENASVITWDVLNNAASRWVVFATKNSQLYSPDEAKEADILFVDTVTETRCRIKGVDEWDLSYVFVRSLCSETEYSSWSDKTTLRTECDDKPLGTVFDFDRPDDVIKFASTGMYNKHAKCFAVGHTRSTNMERDQQYYPNVYANNRQMNNVFARSGENALLFTYTSLSMAGGYIAMPAFDTESLAGMRLSFWMRPVSHSESTGQLQATGSVGTDYARSLTIGSMTDPYDFSTFKEIEVAVYPYTNKDISASANINGDPEGTDWWRQVSLVLPDDCGKYIVFYNSPDYGKSKNLMYVDDIVVAPFDECAAPVRVDVKNIGSSTADVSFVHAGDIAGDWELQVSDQSDMGNIVSSEMLESDVVYPLSGLTPDTRYYVKMRHICNGGAFSDWTNAVSFRTLDKLPFIEQFDNDVYIPDGFRRSSSCSETALFAGTHSLNYSNENDAGWNRDHINGNEFAVLNTNTITNWYLITPLVYLGGGDDMKMRFDVSVTASDSYLPADIDLMNSDKVRFVVLVSDDAGLSWQRKNAVVWSNTPDADYPFSSLSDAMSTMTVDMSAYKDRAVQVAFYVGNSRALGNEGKYVAKVYIDNIRISSMKVVPFTDDICETNSYDNFGFMRHYSELDPGLHEMSRFALAADETRPDTIYNLTLSVNTLSRTYIKDSVCEGQVYGKYNFSTDVAGIQKQKFTFGGSRCDSVVYLDLKVMPVQETVETATICQGQQYEWNGRSYDRTGVYTDTLQSKSCPCDSVVTLVLTVTEAEVTHIDGIVCFGEVYDFGGMILTESGIYRDTVTNSDNCMSITELTLTVLPDYRRSYTAYFCKGTEYSDENFVGVTDPGTYTNPLKSKVGGCDSTITMTLIALGGDTTRVTKTITVEELPFTVEGTDVTYGLNTNPGEYIDTIKVEIGEEDSKCFEVLIHTLIVKEKKGTGVCNVKTRELVLSPNPVRAEDVVTVRLDLTASERGGLVVQLYSNTGSLVRQFKPEHDPIMIDGFPSAGLYIVRIIDGNGSVYTGKVVVR